MKEMLSRDAMGLMDAMFPCATTAGPDWAGSEVLVEGWPNAAGHH